MKRSLFKIFKLWNFGILHDSNAAANEKLNCFYDKLSNLVDTCVPSERITPKEMKLRSKPQINSKIIKLIKYHDRLKRKMKHKLTIENEPLYQGTYL